MTQNCVYQNREDKVSDRNSDEMTQVLKLSLEPAVQTHWSFLAAAAAALPLRPDFDY